MNQIRVRNLRVELTDGRTVVSDVSLQLESGEVLGLVGESGSGKTTLGLALLGHTRAGSRLTGGSIDVAGTEVLGLSRQGLRAARGEVVAYVPQDPATALNPALTLGTQILEGARGRRRRATARARARQLLERAGFDDGESILQRRPRELSGGQQQRVAIVMALMRRPRLVVLDEPTTGLDVVTQAQVLDLVRDLCADDGTAVIYISHDLAVVSRVADRIAVMYAGRFVEQGPPAAVLGDPEHPYTRALVEAVPAVRSRVRVAPIPGRAPNVGDTGSGCTFAPRCPMVRETCRGDEPELRTLQQGHEVRCVLPSQWRRAARSEREILADPVPDTTGPVVFAVEDLAAWHGATPIVSKVSFAVRAGECLALVGESGSGKTTLSRSLVGLHGEWSGRITLHGAALASRAGRRARGEQRALQYIFQNPYASLNPRMTVGNTLREAVRHFFGEAVRHFFGEGGTAAQDRVSRALARVELSPDAVTRYPSELSGGQRQRVAIARALLSEPEVLICDEVTSALDVSVQAAIINLLQNLRADGLALVFVTHNLAVVRSIADAVLVMSRGEIVESGPSGDVFATPRNPYTRALMTHTPEVLS